MLKMISWTDLVKATLLIAGIYYAIVLLLFYRAEGLALVKGRRLREGESTPSNSKGEPEPETEESISRKELVITMMIIEELRTVIKKVTDDQVERKDMLMSITEVLRKYERLDGTFYGSCLNAFIKVECKSKYSIDLQDAEIEDLWG